MIVYKMSQIKKTTDKNSFDKTLIAITTSATLSIMTKKKHEKNALAEPNKMISQLMLELTQQTQEVEKEKEEKKKLEDTIQKLNILLTEAKSYKDKFQDILNESMVYTGEIEKLKKSIEDKQNEIEKQSQAMTEIKQEHEKEKNEINKLNKEVQDYLQNTIKQKEIEIEEAKAKMENIQNTPMNEKEELLLKNQRILEDQKAQIENDYGILDAKLKALVEEHRNLTIQLQQAKIEYNKSLEVSHSKQSEIQSNYLIVNEELSKLKKNNKDVTTKLNDALAYIKRIQADNEEMKEEIEETKKEHEQEMEKLKLRADKGATSSIGFDNLKEILSDYMLQLFKLEKSLTYNDVVDKTLFNFNQITQATFDLIHTSGTISVYHENLKELYFRLYSTINPDHKEINGSEINSDTSNALATDIFKTNFLDVIEQKQYVNKFTEKLNTLGLDKDELNEIMQHYESKSKKYEQGSFSSIRAIVDKCLSTIKNGNIEINKKQCYSFNDYLIPTTLISKGVLIIDNSQVTEDSLNYLINLIKYPYEKITGIKMLGRFLTSSISEKSIKKIFLFLMTYLSSIESFTLNGCELSGNIINYLSFMLENMKHLSSLRLESGSISEENIKILSDILKNSKNLKDLEMKKDNISSAGAFFLADCLTLNKAIKKLSLSCNKINNEGLQTLLNVIQTESSIETLDLSFNLFQERDFKILSEFLLKNPKIQSLSLNGNFLDMACCISLGMSLDKVTHLKILNMSNMNITSDFTPVLFSKFFIEELILDDNPLDEVGHIMLAKALNSNNSLKKLSLKNTKVSSLGLTHILNRIKLNKMIEELHLENNDLDDNSLIILSAFAKDKSCNIYINKRNVKTQKQIALFEKIVNVIMG